MSCPMALTSLKTQGFVLGTNSFSLSINQLPLQVQNISADCDMLADDTTLHTSGKNILQIRSNVQDSLDQVWSWCDNNHTVISRIKTRSVTVATGQKDQLWPLPLHRLLRQVKTDQVSEHGLLGLTIDSQLRWDSHTNTVCKTASRRVVPSVKTKVHCKHRQQESVL